MDISFNVNKEKCIHCGLCKNDCLSKVIEMDENSTPIVVAPNRCINCQHCMAICPVGAISINNKDPQSAEKIFSQNPDMILNLIKSRRSIRQYKHENIDKEILNKLKEMLNYVPTGCNYHKLHFSFIDDVEIMDEFRNYVNNKIINALTKTPIKSVLDKFSIYAKNLINGEDVIFRGAPHIIVVSNSVKAPCPKEDSIIALSYFELYAQSLGLGTCWCGYAQICFNLFPELCEYMKIPSGYQPGYVMLFGSKSVNYSRTTIPDKYNIVSADKNEIKNISAGKTLKRYFWNIIR